MIASSTALSNTSMLTNVAQISGTASTFITDHIFLHQLEIMARIGILPHERESPQPIWLDIDLGIDLRIAGASGNLADTVDYAQLATELAELCMAQHCDLVETLAEALAIHCLADKRIKWVKLRLGKPQALVNCRNVGVLIQREQLAGDQL